MKLKDNCELVMQLLNSPFTSSYLEFEKDGSIIDKVDIEHFVLIHTVAPTKWEKEHYVAKKKTSTRSRKKSQISEDDLLAMEEAQEEELGKGEEKVSISRNDELHLIRKLRKINCGSTSMLGDNGWFICPVYKGMTSLNPVISTKLPNKKGYKLIILSTPLMEFPEDTFTKENINTWELNSILKINSISPVGMMAMSVFVHKREDIKTKTIRNAVNRLETTQRTRIKLGNILIDEVITKVGQEAYVENKEQHAQAAKDSIGDSTDVTEYDTKDVKIIKLIEDAYTRINKTAADMGVKEIPIRRKTTFSKVLSEVSRIEQEEADTATRERLDEWMEKPDLFKKWKTKYQKITGIEVAEGPNWYWASIATKKLSSSDYIPLYITYLNAKSYMEMKKIEDDAKRVVSELVHDTWLWPYIEGIKGCAEITAAYILSDIDFRSTVHPSSVLRYIGLDTVADKPQRKDGQMMTDEDLARIVRFLFHNYESIKKRELEDASLPAIREDTFYKFATDMVSTWREFNAIGYILQSPNLASMTLREVYEVPLYDDFSNLIDKVWNSIDIVEYVNSEGKLIPTIKKHARSKKDAIITTYLTADGKIGTKRSLGYNSRLKARLVEIMFGSMMKNGNPYYYGEIYLNYKKRLEQKYRKQGIDLEAEKMGMRIHRQARRLAVQIFIEDLWMYARQTLGYPLNGGTYYEAKLKRIHGHGAAGI